MLTKGNEMSNGNEVVRVEDAKPLTAAEVKAHVQLIQQVMQAVMVPKTHYDTIAGCGDKPVLLKPGAEKILTTFKIGTDLRVEDLGDGYDFRYRVTIRGFHIPTGNTVGYGVGESSTKEKKYAWRRSMCQAEFDETAETRRRIYWKPKKDKNGYNIKGEAEQELQVRQDPSDLANTVLKMAKKRAMIDLCLTSTACSDIFVQDIDDEDVADNVRNQQEPQPPRYQKPQERQQSAPPQQSQDTGHRYSPKDRPQGGREEQSERGDVISDAQAKRFFAILQSSSGQSPEYVYEELKRIWGYDSSKDILRKDYNDVCAWLERGCQNEPNA